MFILKLSNKPVSELRPVKPLEANCVNALIAVGDNCDRACKAVKSL